MTKLTSLIAVLTLTLVAVSCGSKKEDPSSAEADQQRSELYDAMKSGNMAQVNAVADSLAKNFEDLNTDETVAVLLAYLQVHNDAATRKDRKKDLETIRAFVDAYDIGLQIHGDALVEAFNAARQLNGNVDLPEIARLMREQLADYDASVGDIVEPEETPAAADTAKTEAASKPEPAPKAEPAPKTEPAQPAEPVVQPLD